MTAFCTYPELTPATAGQAEAALRRVVLWASWRLLGWIAAVGATTALVGWLTSSGVLWWDAGTIAEARAKKAQLQAEVAELQASYDGWVKLGVQQKVIRCGPKLRSCIRVDESAGAFGDQAHNDYRVIQGYQRACLLVGHQRRRCLDQAYVQHNDDIVVRRTNLGLLRSRESIDCILRGGYAASQDVSSLNLAASSDVAFFVRGRYLQKQFDATFFAQVKPGFGKRG